MKKKLLVVACIAVIVAMTFTLFACNKSMFDGNFKKEATDEQAKAAWTTATDSLGLTSADSASFGDEEEVVKGWEGMKIAAKGKTSNVTSEANKSMTTEIDIDISGAIKFDMSAMAVNASVKASLPNYNSESDEDIYDKSKNKNIDLSSGLYMRDKVAYGDFATTNSAMKLKADLSDSSIPNAASQLLGDVFTSMSDTFAMMSAQSIAAVLGSIPYDELKALGVKAYINDRGDYNRVKFVMNAEVLARIQGVSEEEKEAFINASAVSDFSLIIVTAKEGGLLQGIQVRQNFSTDLTVNGATNSNVTDLTASIENATEIEYPKDLDSYKDVKDMTLGELEEFLKGCVGDFIDMFL